MEEKKITDETRVGLKLRQMHVFNDSGSFVLGSLTKNLKFPQYIA